MESDSNTTLVRFLLVEDDDDHADLIRMAFESNKISNTVDRVPDAETALDYLLQRGEHAEAIRPGVILLDLNLPKISGHELLMRIKEEESLKTIPVVIMTTSASEADRRQAYAQHANSFLTKPLDFEKFQAMIKDLSLYWSVWNKPVSSP